MQPASFPRRVSPQCFLAYACPLFMCLHSRVACAPLPWSAVACVQVLGIEACRVALLNEIQDVIREGSYVNFRHLAMLVDCMTGAKCSPVALKLHVRWLSRG
jgi:hypothetical protein